MDTNIFGELRRKYKSLQWQLYNNAIQPEDLIKRCIKAEAQVERQQRVIAAVGPFVRMYERAADSGDCGNWMRDEPTYIELARELQALEGAEDGE